MTQSQPLGDNSRSEIKAIAERINGLEDEADELKVQVADIKDQIKEEKAKAVSSGFDKKALDRVLKELRMEPDDRQGVLDLELVVDTYRKALDLPTNEEVLVEAARERINGTKA